MPNVGHRRCEILSRMPEGLWPDPDVLDEQTTATMHFVMLTGFAALYQHRR